MARVSRATILGGLAAAAAAPSFARAADLLPIRVASAATDATAEHFYAHDLGYFAAAGLSEQITTLRNVTEMTAGAIGGSLDVIAGSLVPIAQAHNHGNDLRAIALGNVYTGPPPQGVVVTAENSTIRTGADLNGKTVAVNGLGDFSQVTIQAWIDANGGDAKSVKLLELPFGSVPAALAQGRIDAALLVEPFTTMAKGQVRVIGDALAPVGKHFMVTGWYATATWLNANHDTARRFVDVILQTAKWANKNHDQSAAILAKYSPVPVDVIRASPRALYGEVQITPDWLQPVLDYSTKYIALEKTSAASLIWRA
ncbi:MAG TPA: ABC transporter substrate-binding protein [Candidatus Lustribacter sp.]|jgi:NitT/TauT family transport system substrate-binding protein|nr:ABC transporter substrate-binding protein [Candidatus Lustribacter sp.]